MGGQMHLPRFLDGRVDLVLKHSVSKIQFSRPQVAGGRRLQRFLKPHNLRKHDLRMWNICNAENVRQAQQPNMIETPTQDTPNITSHHF